VPYRFQFEGFPGFIFEDEPPAVLRTGVFVITNQTYFSSRQRIAHRAIAIFPAKNFHTANLSGFAFRIDDGAAFSFGVVRIGPLERNQKRREAHRNATKKSPCP